MHLFLPFLTSRCGTAGVNEARASISPSLVYHQRASCYLGNVGSRLSETSNITQHALRPKEGPRLWDPDPPTRLNLFGVLDPRVGLVYYCVVGPMIVDPLSKLEQRVPRLYVVPEASVKGKL